MIKMIKMIKMILKYFLKSQKVKKSKNNKTAFSLLEIGVVVLVIGVTVGAVVAANGLVQSTKLVMAKLASKNASIGGIENLVFWMDAVSSDSYETPPSPDSSVTKWIDISPQNTVKYEGIATGGTLTYKENVYNGLPMIIIPGSGRFVTDYNPDRGDYTMFAIVYSEGRGTIISQDASGYGNLDASMQFGTTWGCSPAIGQISLTTHGPLSSSTINCIQTDATNYHSTHASPVPVMISAQVNGTSYALGVNGVVKTETLAQSGFFGSNGSHFLQIGSVGGLINLNGGIGEVVIFDRSLSTSELTEVESYLSAKWGISI
jgi:hypothetical protein